MEGGGEGAVLRALDFGEVGGGGKREGEGEEGGVGVRSGVE